MASKFKKGDEVIVISGKYKNSIGKILYIKFPKSNKINFFDTKSKKLKFIKKIKRGPQAIVKGVNIKKKHVKANPQANQKGGIIESESYIDVSNLMFLNPLTRKRDRIGFKYIKGKKVRYFKSNNELVN